MEDDTRWDDMWAYAGPVQGYLDDGFGHESVWAGYTEFLIEVRIGDMMYYHRECVYLDDMYEPDAIYRFTLSRMTNDLDKTIKESA